MLYATLHSGPEAHYITQDLLRDHKFLLGNEMKTIFERWQRSRQLKLKLGSLNKGRVAFQVRYRVHTYMYRVIFKNHNSQVSILQ